MIDIEDVKGLSKDDIIKLLNGDGEQPFQIAISKGTKRFFSDSNDIAVEYIHLACAGQKLSMGASFFDYDSISPDEQGEVVFEVNTSKIEELAENILDVSYGYVNDHEDDVYWFEEVELFKENVERKKIQVACPDFVEWYEEFLSDQDENEDDDSDVD